MSGTALARFDYHYDTAGNRTSKTTPEAVETYGYDRDDRLTTAERGTALWSFGYDGVGNRTGNQSPTGVWTGLYGVSNRLQWTASGGMLRFRGTLNEPGSVTVNSGASGDIPAKMLPGNNPGQPNEVIFEASVPVTPGQNDVKVKAVDRHDPPNLRTNADPRPLGSGPLWMAFSAGLSPLPAGVLGCRTSPLSASGDRSTGTVTTVSEGLPLNDGERRGHPLMYGSGGSHEGTDFGFHFFGELSESCFACMLAAIGIKSLRDFDEHIANRFGVPWALCVE